MTLLKQNKTDVKDLSLIDLLNSLIHPAVRSRDKQNSITAMEIVGLICMTEKHLFESYIAILSNCLAEELDYQINFNEKLVSLKGCMDCLIVHGIFSQKSQNVYDLIIGKYIMSENIFLRQLAIEGIIKMLSSQKLLTDPEDEEGEYLLFNLMVQYFDKKFNILNSFIKQSLNLFFKTYHLFSEQRCINLKNAISKLVFCYL